jgi:hypothetical protein
VLKDRPGNCHSVVLGESFAKTGDRYLLQREGNVEGEMLVSGVQLTMSPLK